MNLQLTKFMRLTDTMPETPGEIRLVFWTEPTRAYAADETVLHFEIPASAKAIARGYSNSQPSRTPWHREVLDTFAGKAETSRLQLPVEAFGPLT